MTPTRPTWPRSWPICWKKLDQGDLIEFRNRFNLPLTDEQTKSALPGALLFAFFDALQLRLQQSGSAVLPYQMYLMYLMLPYLLSIVALVLVARKASYPQALMKPYRRGER